MTDQRDEQVGAVEPEVEFQPTQGEVEALQEKLLAAQGEVAAAQEKFLRARADMDNYKKRMERNYADLAASSKKELLRKVLGVKDNLERALHFGENNDSNGESLMEGVRLTQYQLEQLLQQEGVSAINAHGEPFDPHLEEAIQTVDDPSVPDHTVVQVVRTGYTFRDEVLRPAQVVVSVHAEAK